VSLRLHLSESLLPRQRGPIAPRGGKGIVHVHDADDLRRERDLLPAQLIGIAAAVELLVMPPDDRLDVPRELDRGQQLDAPHRVHLDDVELFARQPSGLVQDLVRDADLADVVQVRPEPHGGALLVVKPEPGRDSERVAGDPLAVAEGVAVARFNRLAPVADHGQVRLFKLSHLATHVNQVRAGVETTEQPVGRVQEAQRLLVAARRLVEQGQLAGGLGFAEERAAADRQLDRRPQPRLGERHAARLPIHHPDHPISVRFVAPGAQLIEDGQRCFRVMARLLEMLAGEMHLGVVQQAQPLQVHVADQLGELPALAEVAVRVLPQVAVGADHAEVVVGDREAFLVASALVRFQGALVVSHRLVVLSLDRREDAEILLDARAQWGALAAQLQGPVEPLAGRFDVAVLEIESGEHVHRLGGEHVVAARDRHLKALSTDFACGGGFAAVMVQHPQPAQRLGVHGALAGLVGHGDRRQVTLHRFRHAPGALLSARVAQQLAGAARPVGARLPGDRQQRAARRQHAGYQATA